MCSGRHCTHVTSNIQQVAKKAGKTPWQKCNWNKSNLMFLVNFKLISRGVLKLTNWEFWENIQQKNLSWGLILQASSCGLDYEIFIISYS